MTAVDDPALRALFLRACDRYARAERWAFGVALSLLLFHLLVVTPLVEQGEARAAETAAATRLAAAAGQVAEVERILAAARSETRAALDPALSALVEGVRKDLARLEATQRQLASAPLVSDAAVESEEALPFEIRDPRQLGALQAALELAADGEAGSAREEVVAALAPVVEELIVRRRFAEVERVWKSEVLPQLEARLNAVASAVSRLRDGYPEGAEAIGAFDGAVTALRRTARDLTFAPPEAGKLTEGAAWWASPASAPTFELGVSPAVAEQLRQPLVLDELEVTAERAAERLGAVAAQLAERRERLAGGDERRAELGRAWTWLGVDLAVVTVLFPLLLGLLLAAVTWQRSARLSELGSAVRMASGAVPARRWLAAVLVEGRRVGAAWRNAWLRAVGTLLLALAWIAVAALQIEGWDGLEPRRWLLTTALGAAAVVAATVHRLAVAHRVAALVDAEAAPPGPAAPPPRPVPDLPPPEDRDSGILDVHTLKR